MGQALVQAQLNCQKRDQPKDPGAEDKKAEEARERRNSMKGFAVFAIIVIGAIVLIEVLFGIGM